MALALAALALAAMALAAMALALALALAMAMAKRRRRQTMADEKKIITGTVKFEAQVTGPDIDGDYDWEFTYGGSEGPIKATTYFKTYEEAETDLKAYLTQIGATIDA